MSSTAGIAETETEATAAALRESETRYRTIFEDNPLPMYVFDLETLRFLAVNGAAVAQYGYSRTDFLSMSLPDLYPEVDREAVRVSAAQAAAAGWKRTSFPGARRPTHITRGRRGRCCSTA